MININQNAYSYLSGQLNSLPDFLHSIQINNICFDSREVNQGDCYIVLPSVAGNENEYIVKAREAGAVLIICEASILTDNANDRVHVEDVMAFSGSLLHKQLGAVTSSLSVVGVTGTNGKSSICYYLAQVAESLATSCAVMGTLGYGKWQNLQTTGMTTLPLEKLHTVLKELSASNKLVAMEVSSHGLEQKRLSGVEFDTAIFSNLTRDHLDYHGTMEAYGLEKSKLFSWKNLQLSIINYDDEFSSNLIKLTTAPVVVTYGQSDNADLKFSFESLDEKGMTVKFNWNQESQIIELPLYGAFNAYNVAAVIAYFLAKKHTLSEILSICSELKPVLGRMQQVIGSDKDPLVLVDYAHTPDALEQVLQSIKHHNKGNIILVIGCGGDRDVGKRALMGEIAINNATNVIFTSDNPRNESPEKICKDMVKNLTAPYDIELDREIAIKKAIAMASQKDLVVIAGKGHEDYQEIGGKRHYFSDVSIAETAMRMESFT